MELHPEILYFGQSDYARSSLAHYATAYGNAMQRNPSLSTRWVLTASTPERLAGMEDAVGIVRRATHQALHARPGATERQIVHAEIGLRSYREFWGSYEACRLRPQSPLCVRFHDPPEMTQPIPQAEIPKKASWVERILTRLCGRFAEWGRRGVQEDFLRRIDVFLCDSLQGSQALAGRFPELRHRIAHMPPILLGAPPAQIEPNDKKALDTVCITLFGFLQRGKAIGELLKALVLVHRRMPLVKRGRLMIRGSLPADASGRATAEAIEARIRDMGLRWLIDYKRLPLSEDEVDDLLRQTDILVLPYPSARCATGSMTLMRAAAWGVAVLSSRAGAIPELLKHEEDALLYQASNIQELSEALEELIRNHEKRKELAVNLRRKAMRLWTPERVSDIAAELYNEMLVALREGHPVKIPKAVRMFEPPEEDEALPEEEERRSKKASAEARRTHSREETLADDGSERANLMPDEPSPGPGPEAMAGNREAPPKQGEQPAPNPPLNP